ncbi:MAG TPA: uroporphyrinogen decarboxylase family protein [Syntrophales bacterium]|nr:uroporphyrinogen decarboxylase family protein [Syntrophales bacterium]
MDKQALYQDRLNRIQKTINYERVAQIPIVFMGIAFAPRYMGLPMSKFCVDEEAAVQVTLDTVNKIGEIDGINYLPGGRIHIVLSSIWLSKTNIPGRELPEGSLWQVVEKEVMTPGDYDFIVEHGWQAFLGQHMPKVVDMEEFHAAMGWIMQNMPAVAQRFRENGYVILSGGATTIPFEYFCGGRSMSKFFLDLYRMPDRVQAAMDVIVPEMISAGIGAAKLSGSIGVWVGGWRAASAMVAPKIWNRMVWPYYQQIVGALVAEGIVPIFHWDQDWTRDLHRLKELPAKKCILNLDGMTDIRMAKEILDGHMAIMGDVPASLFAAGTPDDIYNYVRDLVRDVGPEGLLLCPGCDAPINTKPENMEAFVAAGREFGALTAKV